MPAHVSCRPVVQPDDPTAGCFVVCADHDLHRSFGTQHAVAHAACVEHNRLHHPVTQKQSPRILSLTYESSATAELTEAGFAELLGQARYSNSVFGVTGMLVAEGGWFLQVLEGPELVVRRLMESIRRDPRHGRIRVIEEEIIPERRFPDWAMAHGHVGEIEALPSSQYYEALLMARAQPAA